MHQISNYLTWYDRQFNFVLTLVYDILNFQRRRRRYLALLFLKQIQNRFTACFKFETSQHTSASFENTPAISPKIVTATINKRRAIAEERSTRDGGWTKMSALWYEIAVPGGFHNVHIKINDCMGNEIFCIGRVGHVSWPMLLLLLFAVQICLPTLSVPWTYLH